MACTLVPVCSSSERACLLEHGLSCRVAMPASACVELAKSRRRPERSCHARSTVQHCTVLACVNAILSVVSLLLCCYSVSSCMCDTVTDSRLSIVRQHVPRAQAARMAPHACQVCSSTYIAQCACGITGLGSSCIADNLVALHLTLTSTPPAPLSTRAVRSTVKRAFKSGTALPLYHTSRISCDISITGRRFDCYHAAGCALWHQQQLVYSAVYM